MHDASGKPLLRAITEALREREGVLVLDSCEHLVNACAHVVDALLQGCWRVRVLATSRQSLGVAGEHAWRVPSLRVPIEGEAGVHVMRYRLLEPVRRYAAVKVGEAGEEPRVRMRHRDWCVAHAQAIAAAWNGHQAGELLDGLERELDNLRAAIGWCIQVNEALPGFALVDTLWFFWNVRGRLGEWHARLAELLALPSASHLPEARARALNAAGYLAVAQGDVQAAEQARTQAVSITRTLPDAPGLMIMGLRRLGIVSRIRGDTDAAIAYLEQALALARETADAPSAYLCLCVLAETLRATGNLRSAIECYEESLALMRAAGDVWHVGHVLLGLGYTLAATGEHAAAREALCEGLRGFAISATVALLRAASRKLGFVAALERRADETGSGTSGVPGGDGAGAADRARGRH